VRLKAAECIVEKALEDGKPDGKNVQVNVSDDASACGEYAGGD